MLSKSSPCELICHVERKMGFNPQEMLLWLACYCILYVLRGKILATGENKLHNDEVSLVERNIPRTGNNSQSREISSKIDVCVDPWIKFFLVISYF